MRGREPHHEPAYGAVRLRGAPAHGGAGAAGALGSGPPSVECLPSCFLAPRPVRPAGLATDLAELRRIGQPPKRDGRIQEAASRGTSASFAASLDHLLRRFWASRSGCRPQESSPPCRIGPILVVCEGSESVAPEVAGVQTAKKTQRKEPWVHRPKCFTHSGCRPQHADGHRHRWWKLEVTPTPTPSPPPLPPHPPPPGSRRARRGHACRSVGAWRSAGRASTPSATAARRAPGARTCGSIGGSAARACRVAECGRTLRRDRFSFRRICSWLADVLRSTKFAAARRARSQRTWPHVAKQRSQVWQVSCTHLLARAFRPRSSVFNSLAGASAFWAKATGLAQTHLDKHPCP